MGEVLSHRIATPVPSTLRGPFARPGWFATRRRRMKRGRRSAFLDVVVEVLPWEPLIGLYRPVPAPCPGSPRAEASGGLADAPDDGSAWTEPLETFPARASR